MNILVTGAGTLIGNNIYEELISKNFKVIAGYRKTKPKNLKKKYRI